MSIMYITYMYFNLYKNHIPDSSNSIQQKLNIVKRWTLMVYDYYTDKSNIYKLIHKYIIAYNRTPSFVVFHDFKFQKTNLFFHLINHRC